MIELIESPGAQAPQRSWRLRYIEIYGAMSSSFRRLRVAILTANPQQTRRKKTGPA